MDPVTPPTAGKENAVDANSAPSGPHAKASGFFFVSASPPVASPPAPQARLVLSKFQKPVMVDFKVHVQRFTVKELCYVNVVLVLLFYNELLSISSRR